MLDPAELLYAYSQGYFPMAIPEDDNEIFWFKPEMRGIIPLDTFHISKNLRRLYNKQHFELRINGDFEGTMRACAEREDTWISEDIVQSYCKLHEMGYGFSFEAWREGKLVGGLYGVMIGKAYFGESMFHRENDASKIALIFLVQFLKDNGFKLLDTQYINDHLKQFGATEVPNADYENMLAGALEVGDDER
ncbi:leucyl/phenylalanyl-tRNA--protein transferase [Bacteroidia bacterium]|mgnify:FL=1|jgi:leucyl/phenylalanyl-tRNA--protein transferase|nr:leucyl/phenylalanyl-tRNA--protein transferase [Bacteroidia bacterium]|tara:strand:+ start:280 stop:855 length:576 start_codon:yes stop_codon:yes gene_type:complete